MQKPSIFKRSPNYKALIKGLESIPDQWTLTPVGTDKRPYRKDWQNEPPVKREIIIQGINGIECFSEKKNKHYKRFDHGYGVRTGEASNGLLAVDFDGVSSHPLWESIKCGKEDPVTVSWTSGKEGREQRAYQIPDKFRHQLREFNRYVVTEHRRVKSLEGELLEFRYNRCQSVLPPSHHPTTGHYKWINSPDTTAIAIAPEWLCEFILGIAEREKAEAEKKAKQQAIARKIRAKERDLRILSGNTNLEDILQQSIDRLGIDAYDWSGHNFKETRGRLEGCCPNHQSTSGSSFHVNQSTLEWFCFGCGVGGHVADYKYFVNEGKIKPRYKDFVAIVKELAKDANIEFVEWQKHNNYRNPLEPDADQYQAYIEWENKQEEIEEAQETSEFIDWLKARFNGLGKHFKKGFGFTQKVNQTDVKLPDEVIYDPDIPLPTPDDYQGKQPPTIIFKKGNRNKLNVKLIQLGWKHILDASPTGTGKSYDNGNFAVGNGKHWHILVEHRNPSTPTIKDNFTDLNPRHEGIYQVGDRLELKGEENQLITPSNCSNVEAFRQLSNKNYDPFSEGVNEVCKNCIHWKIKQESDEKDEDGKPKLISKCGASEGEGYGFLYQRKQAFEASLIRCHKEQLSDPEAYDYLPDILSIEEASRSLGTKQITGTLDCFDRQMLDLREKNLDYFLAIQKLLKLRPYLEKDKKRWYGLKHKEILDIIGKVPENIEEIIHFCYNEFNQLDDVFIDSDSTGTIDYKKTGITREQAKTARKWLRIQAKEETIENINELPNNILTDLLEVWGGNKGALKTNRYGEIIITRPDFKTQRILKSSKANIYLDATVTIPKLSALIDVDPNQIITIKQEATKKKNNLTIHAVDFSGLGSNNWGKTRNDKGKKLTKEDTKDLSNTLKRLLAADVYLKGKHTEISIYALMKYQEILENKYYWFNHNRGGNHDQGKEAIAAFGLPRPDMGGVESEFICLFGATEFDDENKPIGFDDYYNESINQEVVQFVGRQRTDLYPDKQFHCYIFAPNLDLTFLEDLGYNVIYEDEYQYIPELTRRRKRDKWAIVEMAKGLAATGQKITQQAIAQKLGISQGWISKLFGGGETLTWKEFAKLFHSLYIANKESGIITTSTVENATMREWLGLQPFEVAKEMIKTIHDDGWQSVVDYLRYVCPHEAFQILGILALFTSNADQIFSGYLPPPPQTE